jgi:hypothetical protein
MTVATVWHGLVLVVNIMISGSSVMRVAMVLLDALAELRKATINFL